MKKLITGILFAVLLTSSALATTYTKSSGTSFGTETSSTQSHSITLREGTTLTKATDTAVGGLSSSNCTISCSAADNKVSSTERVFTKTNLTITNIGSNQTTASSASCFSGVNINGLNATEAKGSRTYATVGSSIATAVGSVYKKTVTASTSTNGGAEVGSSRNVVVDNTSINESTNTTFTSGGNTITFTSSIGE
jgi:hypothetical protein